jgi:CheY-like chemotaxis protein
MSPETLAHIFEPFFTTKPVGKGTGLGLSTVFGTVRQAGGHLDVESAPGRGTEFRLYLPAVADPSSPPVPPPPASRRLDRARTILVVEDDPAVLRVATRILRSEGYEVLEAASIDAARAVAARAGAIDLLLVDVVLPGMRGAALAAEIGAGRPGMRVLLMSGHGDASFGQSNVLRERDAFLDKPFTPDSLTRKVRETIESGDGGR